RLDTHHLRVFLPIPPVPRKGRCPAQHTLLRFTPAWGMGSPRFGMGAGGMLEVTHLLCFLFNGANYSCNRPPKRERGVWDPWQLLLLISCPGEGTEVLSPSANHCPCPVDAAQGQIQAWFPSVKGLPPAPPLTSHLRGSQPCFTTMMGVLMSRPLGWVRPAWSC
uniref:Uncharacterized protein n=1 Tax=Calidris pygmaea TaxID=425635 RepID=A0A8C3PQ11_9CHAR